MDGARPRAGGFGERAVFQFEYQVGYFIYKIRKRAENDPLDLARLVLRRPLADDRANRYDLLLGRSGNERIHTHPVSREDLFYVG